MGLFSGFKNTLKKSEAAVIVQDLLQMQVDAGLLERDPAKLANTLVETAWSSKPDIFNGGFGQRPFKLSVAAISLGMGIQHFANDEDTRNALIISLGNILSELEVNGRLYPLNGIDEQLLSAAMAIFAEATEEMLDSPLGCEIDDILGGS